MIASGSGFLLSGVGALLNHEGKYDDQFESDELIMKRRQRACTVMFMLAITAALAFLISLSAPLKFVPLSEYRTSSPGNKF